MSTETIQITQAEKDSGHEILTIGFTNTPYVVNHERRLVPVNVYVKKSLLGEKNAYVVSFTDDEGKGCGLDIHKIAPDGLRLLGDDAKDDLYQTMNINNANGARGGPNIYTLAELEESRQGKGKATIDLSRRFDPDNDLMSNASTIRMLTDELFEFALGSVPEQETKPESEVRIQEPISRASEKTGFRNIWLRAVDLFSDNSRQNGVAPSVDAQPPEEVISPAVEEQTTDLQTEVVVRQKKTKKEQMEAEIVAHDKRVMAFRYRTGQNQHPRTKQKSSLK